MKFEYRPMGVCSSLLTFEIEDNIIKDLKVVGGCNGNLKGISKLVQNRSVEEVISSLDGITCGYKQTSCPDQIAKALKSYLNK